MNLVRVNKLHGEKFFEPLKSSRRGASLARNCYIIST